VFTCGALHAVRDHMYSRLDGITSGAFGQLMYDEPLDTVLLGLLGDNRDNYWGEKALAVDSCVRSFLVEAWAARELAVAARGHVTVLDSEVDLESEHVPEIVRARVPVPIGSAAGAVLGAGERICAECHSRRRADAMVQCKACLRWFHKSCGGATSSMSVGDWVCSPCAVVVPASPSGSPLHTHRRQRREGPWRSR
jgi:hypothetical protein